MSKDHGVWSKNSAAMQLRSRMGLGYRPKNVISAR